MVRTCPHCGARLPPTEDAYCPDCREPLDEPPSPAPSAAALERLGADGLLGCRSCHAAFGLSEAFDATARMQTSWDFFTADCPACRRQLWLLRDEDRPETLWVGELISYGARPDVATYQTVRLPGPLRFEPTGGVSYLGRRWTWPRH